MAVTMVVGNSIGGSLSLLKPGYTMSSIIANEFAEAVSPLHTQALIRSWFDLIYHDLTAQYSGTFAGLAGRQG